MIFNIINLEKKKVILKIILKFLKNIKIDIKNNGCFGNKYLFFFTKKINKDDFTFKNYKNKILKFNVINYKHLNNIKIKFKKKFKIKNKEVKNLCDCKFSFKIY